MANALKGKASVAIVWVCPNKLAAQAMREFLRDHLEWMQLKSYQDGPLKLIYCSISESPEYVHDDMAGVRENIQKRLAKPYFICMKSTTILRDCIITGSKVLIFSPS